jgi:pimeloyl-ACP methyl ester carboxylesterase
VRIGEDRIVYEVLGEGPLDLVYLPATGECIGARWEYPAYVGFLRGLGSFGRLIMFDRRGYGASDAASDETLPYWEQWADDTRAVLAAVGSERAAIFGTADAGLAAMFFAATWPARTQALILAHTTARFRAADDYPWGVTDAEIDRAARVLEDVWGTETYAKFRFPDASRDPAFAPWLAKMARLCYTPRQASTHFRRVQSADVRDVLPSIGVPTLVLARANFASLPLDQSRDLADHIPGARFAVVPGADHGLFTAPTSPTLSHIDEVLQRS